VPASDATASALLTTEARSLALLRQVVSLHAGKPRAAAPLLVSAIAQSRAAARREGARTMALEVKRNLPAMPDVRDLDRRYAERAVRGYLKALDGADEKREAGETVHVPRVIESKLDLIAATEVPSAFSEERERIEVRFVREDPTFLPFLWKVWNARLDGACPVCRGLHRKKRHWGIEFEGGKQPGRAHPRCHCYATYMPIPVFVLGDLRRQERRATGAWEVVQD
jgi:hypothetical protein